ncbi:DUF6506 family protein [Actinomycetes bacterium KLBMP 9759]
MSPIEEMFLFLAPGSDAATDRVTFEHDGARTLLVWAPDAAAAAGVAREQADNGIKLIELYRGFDLAAAAGVIEAVDGRVPVGVAGTIGATTPAASRDSVTIYEGEHVEPVVHTNADGSRTVVVGASGTDAAVDAATTYVREGAGLVEICGGTKLGTAAAVSSALDGTAAVTLVSWPLDSIRGAAAYNIAWEESQASA